MVVCARARRLSLHFERTKLLRVLMENRTAEQHEALNGLLFINLLLANELSSSNLVAAFAPKTGG
jgi:hypothetical protein